MDTNTSGRKIYRDSNLRIIFGITLMAVMGVASITPAFPTIARDLDISAQKVGLLITVFTLPGVFLVPVLGVLADRYGRKKVVIPALMLFGVAGGACFFARDFHLLLILRFFQGMGGSSLGSINTTLIGDLYEGRQRAAAMGYNASVLSMGTASYPLIGGALAALAWHYPFLLSLIAIPIGFLVLLKLKNPEPKKPESMSEYLHGVWRSINRQVIGLFFASLITFIILYGVYLSYFPFLVEIAFNGSPVTIGLLMSTMSLTTAITSARLGKLSQKFTAKKLLLGGFVLYGSAMAITPYMPTVWLLLVPTVIFGLGHGVNIPSLLTLMSGFAPLEHRAAFMSMNSMVLRAGQTIGPLFIGVFFTLGGIKLAFLSGSALTLIMLLIIAVSLEKDVS
ncbi:MAG: MFS transporter [Candidatus Zixiibacteriota bacterium]|nr:MAG: MFS transporter [candidate division Zixibacteria bacterium]